MTNVKWLDGIESVGEPFLGYQMTSGYRYTQSIEDPGDPVNIMRVKALMKPPGIPDFLTRNRLVEAGTVELSGRAWAGRAQVTRVEVSADGGETWWDGKLEDTISAYAWRGWHAQWEARPGHYMLCVRATDDQSNVQPVPQPWNFKGMGNNMAHRVSVLVE